VQASTDPAAVRPPAPPSSAPVEAVRRRSSRFELLDAGRGVACLMVVLFHSVGWALDDSHRGALLAPLRAFEQWGWLGVQIFFVISGYCIAAAAAALPDEPSSRREFARRRFRRIVPTLWAAMAVVAALGLTGELLASRGIDNPLDDETKIGWHWVTNLALVEPTLATFGVKPLYGCGVIWSLCYEAQFYVVAALGLVARARRTVVATLVGVTAASVLVRAVPGLRCPGFLTDLWLDFAAGLWLFARLVLPLGPRARRAADVGLFGAVALEFALVTRHAGSTHAAVQDAKNAVFCAVVALALLALHRFDARLARTAPARALAWVGTRSYAIYLLHLPLVRTFATWFGRQGLSKGLALYATTAAGVAAALALSNAFHHLVERRFLSRPASRPVPST